MSFRRRVGPCSLVAGLLLRPGFDSLVMLLGLVADVASLSVVVLLGTPPPGQPVVDDLIGGLVDLPGLVPAPAAGTATAALSVAAALSATASLERGDLALKVPDFAQECIDGERRLTSQRRLGIGGRLGQRSVDALLHFLIVRAETPRQGRGRGDRSRCRRRSKPRLRHRRPHPHPVP